MENTHYNLKKYLFINENGLIIESSNKKFWETENHP